MNDIKQPTVLGHPVGLFVLFFTEMWERFSYYGMRALLVIFLTTRLVDGGWGWGRERAYALFGWYVMLVYFLPMLGGWLADNKWGHVKTVIVGSIIITLGHASMAIADLGMNFMFYVGLLLIVFGTGLFKPNMTSIVGKLYSTQSDKKDSAYTIFYMGVNSGAFIGTLLVGWIGETFSWSYGFGLAGIFMLFGLLQFYFARKIFGEESSKPSSKKMELLPEEAKNIVPYTKFDLLFVGTGIVLAVTWVIEGVASVITDGFHFLPQNLFSVSVAGAVYEISLSFIFFVLSLIVFFALGISRIKRYQTVERDQLKVVFIIASFVIVFWASFEQAGTTMTIFARDYTARSLIGGGALIYKIVDIVLSFTPMLILTWVIVNLSKKIFKKYPISIVCISVSFLVIWYLVLVRVGNNLLNIQTGSLAEVWAKFSSTSLSDMFGKNVEVNTTWFQILNPFFIVILAPMFSEVWKRFKFSAPQKFFIGFLFLGIGFGLLAFGASGIPAGAKVAQVSIVWLVLAYLFNTMGELSISPVGLSYVSKLAPARMVAFIFGMWYIFTGLANKLAGIMAENSDSIAIQNGISGYYLIFTIIPILAGIAILCLNKPINKLMHEVS